MDNKLKFQGCKLTFDLKAQSPHIHFQSKELGSTLRGSELKPKLDAFLCRKLGKEKSEALDYKVQINCKEQPVPVEIGILPNKNKGIQESYSIFFGNTGRKQKHEKELEGVWSDPTFSIICFNDQLKTLIEDHITEFFFTHNFGMMQGKGFGSYIPAGTEGTPKATVQDWLAENYNTKKCWNIELKSIEADRNQRCNTQSSMIKFFYGILKSGKNFGGYERSFLFEYMHKNSIKVRDTSNIIESIDNEKAWMKQKGIAPAYSQNVANNDKHDRRDKNSRYVRALLGLSGTQSWLEGKNEEGRPKRVNISIKDPKNKNKIERISSPVLFKIVGNDVYFIIRKIPDEVYNHEFEFEGIGKADTLKTPLKDQFTNGAFDVEAFISEYITYFNKKYDSVKMEEILYKFNKITEWRCNS